MSDRKDSAIRYAAAYPDARILKLLLQKGARPDSNPPTMLGSALIDAVTRHRYRNCVLLLQHGARVHIADPASTDSHDAAEVALWFAVEDNQVEITRLLLKYGADPRATSGTEATTLLNDAARLCHVEMTSFLLKKGADPNRTDADGDTALMSAVHGAYMGPRAIRTIRILLDAGADKLRQNHAGESPLSLARSKGLRGIVRILEQRRGRRNGRAR